MPVIRLATETDLLAASKIYHRSLSDAKWLSLAARKRISFECDTDGEEVYVYVSDSGEIYGFVSIWTASSFVHHLYVDSRFRRSGVGSALLQSLDRWLPRPWSLKCLKENTAALAFYLTLGWDKTGSGESDDGPYWLLQKKPDEQCGERE